MSLERVEPPAPVLPVGREPRIELGERLGPEPVDTPLPLGSNPNEAGLAEHAEVLRDARLAELQMLDELADGPLALPKQLEDLPPRRVRDSGEGGSYGSRAHGEHITARLYISPSVEGLGAFPCEMAKENALPPDASGRIGRVRSTATLTAAVSAGLAVLAGAAAASPPAAAAAQTITAAPKTVATTDIQTVRGSGWPVIEFCSRTVRVSVRSAQNSAPIAQRHVRANGRFSFRWSARNKNVGPGRWRLVARMRCESGKDGSTVFVRASTRITIN
jgi:hypothetical protein